MQCGVVGKQPHNKQGEQIDQVSPKAQHRNALEVYLAALEGAAVHVVVLLPHDADLGLNPFEVGLKHN